MNSKLETGMLILTSPIFIQPNVYATISNGHKKIKHMFPRKRKIWNKKTITLQWVSEATYQFR